MNQNDYIDQLRRLKRLAVDRFGILTQIEHEILEASFEWLVDNLEIKKGEVVVDEELSHQMDEFVQAVVSIVNNNDKLQGRITGFLTDLKQIQKNNIAFHATTNQFNIETAGVKNIQKVMVNEILDQYTGNGLNVHFAGPLKENVFRNMLTGANMKDVKQTLQAYILSGQDQSGKLHRYLNQTAQQSVDTYTGAINQQLVKEFKFTGYIISGSLIETSSEQCIEAVDTSKKGYLSFAEWEKILEIARNNKKAKLIEGTTIKNLPLNKLHWGCRHDFTPTIKKEK